MTRIVGLEKNIKSVHGNMIPFWVLGHYEHSRLNRSLIVRMVGYNSKADAKIPDVLPFANDVKTFRCIGEDYLDTFGSENVNEDMIYEWVMNAREAKGDPSMGQVPMGEVIFSGASEVVE